MHKWDWKKVCDIVVGDFIVHESDQLRAVLEVGIRSENGKLGVRLAGQGWYCIYWNPDHLEQVLVKNE
jgi:hypothetical protein